MIYIHRAQYWVQIKLIQTFGVSEVHRLNMQARNAILCKSRILKYFGFQPTKKNPRRNEISGGIK